MCMINVVKKSKCTTQIYLHLETECVYLVVIVYFPCRNKDFTIFILECNTAKKLSVVVTLTISTFLASYLESFTSSQDWQPFCLQYCVKVMKMNKISKKVLQKFGKLLFPLMRNFVKLCLAL